MRPKAFLSVTVLLGLIAFVEAAKPDKAKRGFEALTTRSFTPPVWKLGYYDTLWKHWDNQETKPKNYSAAFNEHYGLHPAPFDNGNLPMGLREASGFFGKGMTNTCMLCHGGSIMGKSYIGLGNSTLDLQALFEDLDRAGGGSGKTPIQFSRTRGTNEAAAAAVFLISYREPNLSPRFIPYDLELRDDLCEDVPAWWLLRKKKTMYFTGSNDARSVRSIMQFMMSPLNGRAQFEKEESTFKDIRQYLLSLRAPKYPFDVDEKLAVEGKRIFNRTCTSCHGTYGEKWTYPNKIVPIDIIGTDRARYDGLSAKTNRHYNKSWFAKEKRADGTIGYLAVKTPGYQAPPLDGIWATAPYFHNGSAPTVYHVLNSKSRPKLFTRSFRTNEQAYDKTKLGWKVQVLKSIPKNLTPFELRKIYDTSKTGRGNGGHTFGDDLTEQERTAVIEYLKTL